MKLYIDESIQASTASVINSIKQYIDSSFDRQRTWNEQLLSNIANINNTLAKITQSKNSHSTIPRASTSSSHAAPAQHPQHPMDTPLPYTTEQASRDIQSTVLQIGHLLQFRLAQGITLHESPSLQSASNTLTEILPRSMLLTSIECEILGVFWDSSTQEYSTSLRQL
ncbi:hypothetical protein C2G38_2113603, partial [Gigaspora rosea]